MAAHPAIKPNVVRRFGFIGLPQSEKRGRRDQDTVLEVPVPSLIEAGTRTVTRRGLYLLRLVIRIGDGRLGGRIMKRLLAIVGLSVLSAAGAHADTDEATDSACMGHGRVSSERVIEACSAVISDGRPDKRLYARAFRAEAFIGKRAFTPAIADLNEVLAQDTQQAAIYWMRATAYAGNGDIERALADMTRGIYLKPDEPDVYYARGYVYASKREAARAISDFTHAIALRPGFRDAYYARAIVYEDAALYDRALADYTRMIELDASDSMAYLERATLNYELGNEQAAMADFLIATAPSAGKPDTTVRRSANRSDDVYVMDCVLDDGSSVSGYMRKVDKTKPPDFDYARLQRNPKTGYCTKEVAAKERERRLLVEKERDKNRQLADARRASEPPARVRPPDDEFTSPLYAYESDRGRDANGFTSSPRQDYNAPFSAPKFPTYESQIRAPQYIPHTPSNVVTHMDAETYKRTTPRLPSSINDLDTRYNPFATVDEATHGRGRRYDPYATKDSWAYDRANPYAVVPQYKRGIYNPLSPSGTPYNPSTTFGGGPQPNNWRSNRYDPFGTRRTSSPISGTGQGTLTPMHPPSNCPRQPSSRLDPHARQC
jgi:tetratricopeptide (TPR) repeat protein